MTVHALWGHYETDPSWGRMLISEFIPLGKVFDSQCVFSEYQVVIDMKAIDVLVDSVVKYCQLLYPLCNSYYMY